MPWWHSRESSTFPLSARCTAQLAALAAEGVCHVSLNVAEVTFVDSTGLSILVSEHKRAESMNGELIIFSPSTQLRELLQITGLDSYLNIRPNKA